MILECINFLSKIIMPICKWVKINAGTFMALLLNLIVYYLIVKFVGYENFDKIDKIFTIGCFICTSALSYYFFSEWIENRNKIKEQKLKEKLIAEIRHNEAEQAKKRIYGIIAACNQSELDLFKEFVNKGTTINIDYTTVNIVKDLMNKGFGEVLGLRYRLSEGTAFITPDFYYILKSYFNNHTHKSN